MLGGAGALRLGGAKWVPPRDRSGPPGPPPPLPDSDLLVLGFGLVSNTWGLLGGGSGGGSDGGGIFSTCPLLTVPFWPGFRFEFEAFGCFVLCVLLFGSAAVATDWANGWMTVGKNLASWENGFWFACCCACCCIGWCCCCNGCWPSFWSARCCATCCPGCWFDNGGFCWLMFWLVDCWNGGYCTCSCAAPVFIFPLLRGGPPCWVEPNEVFNLEDEWGLLELLVPEIVWPTSCDCWCSSTEVGAFPVLL